MKLIFGVWTLYRKEVLKKKKKHHNSDYPAAASILFMLFKKNLWKKKRIKRDYSYYFLILYRHSHWTSCEFYSVDSCWALPTEETDRGRCWWRDGRVKRGGGRGWKRNVCLEGNPREKRWMVLSFSVFTSGKGSCLKCCGAVLFYFYENFIFSFFSGWVFFFVCFIDVKKFGMVCLKVTECLF